MQKDDCSARPFFAGQLLLLSAAVTALAGPLLPAQEIHIRVLNARNGEPITKECVNVWLPNFYGAHMVAGTNREGIVALHLTENRVAGDVACTGWPASATRPRGADAVTVSGDSYVVCQEYGKTLPGDASNPNAMKELMPSYPIKRILDSGVSAANTCGRFKAQAKPGELILYARPRSFLQKLRM